MEGPIGGADRGPRGGPLGQPRGRGPRVDIGHDLTLFGICLTLFNTISNHSTLVDTISNTFNNIWQYFTFLIPIID